MLSAIVFHLDAYTHQWLSQLTIGVSADPRFTYKSKSCELQELFCGCLVTHQTLGCDVLYGGGPRVAAQKLDQLSLCRRQLTETVLIIGGEVVNHPQERSDKLVQGLFIEKIEQYDIYAVVAPSKMVDRPHPCAAHRSS